MEDKTFIVMYASNGVILVLLVVIHFILECLIYKMYNMAFYQYFWQRQVLIPLFFFMTLGSWFGIKNDSNALKLLWIASQ